MTTVYPSFPPGERHAVRFAGPEDPYGFLSLEHAHPLELAGERWDSIAHYLEAQLAEVEGPTLRALKAEDLLRPALRAKFAPGSEAGARLLATGRLPLVQSPRMERLGERAAVLMNGHGHSLLSVLLEERRALLAAELPHSVNRALVEWLHGAGRLPLAPAALPAPPEALPPLTPPFLATPPRTHASPARWPRVEGMLLGLAVGEALAHPTTGMTPARRSRRFGLLRDYLPNPHAEGKAAGTPAAATQLAFRTLAHLLEEGGLVPEQLARRLVSGRIFGLGATLRSFVQQYGHGTRPWYDCTVESAGGGALVRVAPVLLPHLRHAHTYPSAELWADALLAATLTHNSGAANAASLAFTALLWDLLGMASPPPGHWYFERFLTVLSRVEPPTLYRARSKARAIDGFHGTLGTFLARYVETAWQEQMSVADACEWWYSSAYILEAVPSALYILMRHGHDPEEALVQAVNETWANDLIAALVGAAVGALHGSAALPARWRSGLTGRLNAADDGALHALLAQAQTMWAFGE